MNRQDRFRTSGVVLANCEKKRVKRSTSRWTAKHSDTTTKPHPARQTMRFDTSCLDSESCSGADVPSSRMMPDGVAMIECALSFQRSIEAQSTAQDRRTLTEVKLEMRSTRWAARPLIKGSARRTIHHCRFAQPLRLCLDDRSPPLPRYGAASCRRGRLEIQETSNTSEQ